MDIMSIPISDGGIDADFERLGDIKVKIRKATLFSASPTIEQANMRLREKAHEMGGNAVLYVNYERGMSLTSYEVLTATGVVVSALIEERQCPACAEMVKRQARKCRFCGEALDPL